MSENQNPPVVTPPVDPPVTPPPTTLQGRAPNHADDLLASLDPKIKAYFENTIAEKANALHAAKIAQEASKKAEAELAVIKATQDKAAQDALIEQGKYKELWEAEHTAKVALEAQVQNRAIEDAVKREVVKAGGLDEDIASLVYARHGQQITYKDGVAFGVAEALSLFKAEKPHLFKAPEPPPPPPAPPRAGTVPPRVTPDPGGVAPFSAASFPKTAQGKADLESAWRSAIQNLPR